MTTTSSSKIPTANVVARALRRDFGSRTAPYNRPGYHVSGNGKDAARISVDFSYAPGSTTDVLRAKWLLEILLEASWEAHRSSDDSTIVYVTKVPTAAEQRARGWVWDPDA